MTEKRLIQLCQAEEDWREGVATWTMVANKIKEYCSIEQDLMHGKFKPPSVDVLPSGIVIMDLPSIRLGCQYRPKLGGEGVLLFGYFVEKSGREPKLKVTQKINLDSAGNLLQTNESNQRNLNTKDFYKEVFFDECMKALEAYNEKL